MTPEELLKPRYKVIADYPGSDFKVGIIIEMDSQTDFFTGHPEWQTVFVPSPDGGGGIYCELKFKPYPHLFAPLRWWEYRKLEDMPEYVKKLDGEIRKIKQHFCNSSGEPNQFGCQLVIDEKIEKEVWNYFSYRNLTPATESDYQTYLASKQ